MIELMPATQFLLVMLCSSCLRYDLAHTHNPDLARDVDLAPDYYVFQLLPTI